jgi:hypothetical protein
MVAKNILCNCGCWDEGNRGREGSETWKISHSRDISYRAYADAITSSISQI